MMRKSLGDYSQQVAGTNLVRGNVEALEGFQRDVAATFTALTKLNSGQDSRNVAHRLRAYRELSETLMDCYTEISGQNERQARHIAQLKGERGDSANKRWSSEQDAALVELACAERSSMMTLALAFNRTPAAIASRLTYLVGVSQVSRHVVGRITGYLDGEPVSGRFDGELRTAAPVTGSDIPRNEIR